ncbi:KfrB domain-containing protein [Achromobacter mucicolens]|uniref:KfrB domain-containing protein n=1 Tax=Achromobacter mucicolens TaxID=1389922 RepID=UPI0022F3ADA2|nr:hypothetical protein [Achromobacter mucicolens]WBX89168.1 hypothetical protein PE062_00575 [Achromobacter mucicolens]
MKISDLKAKFQALFHPAQPHRAPVSTGSRALSANADRDPVEISVPSTGERLLHAPSSSRPGEISHAADQMDVDPADSYEQHLAALEREAEAKLRLWDGKSVGDIDAGVFDDFRNLEDHPVMRETVPTPVVRKDFLNPSPLDENAIEIVTLLAVDVQGQALLKTRLGHHVSDFEQTTYDVMPIAEAIDQLQQHGASKDLTLVIGETLWRGSTPAEVKPAEVGATYRGAILDVQGSKVYQLVSNGTAIAHDAGRMSVPDPQRFVGKEAEISYPCGKVGLVRQVDTLALEATALHKAGAEKTSAALER